MKENFGTMNQLKLKRPYLPGIDPRKTYNLTELIDIAQSKDSLQCTNLKSNEDE
jgi:hypothetical protein